MSEQSFFRSLSKNNRYIVGNLFFMYIVQGIFTIMIGAILPMIKEEYGLNYQVGGMLISAHSIGNVAVGLLAGVLPLYLGIKNSLMMLYIFTFIGFGMTLASYCLSALRGVSFMNLAPFDQLLFGINLTEVIRSAGIKMVSVWTSYKP